ncbi:MAG: N-6 DNA methylase [Patescibacteria group bacterium]|jgi:type I restriction enzyme M protein
MTITQQILSKIFKNPEQDLLMFDDLAKIEIYQKEEGKYYVKSISRLEEEKLVYNEKTGKSAPEEIVRQLYLLELTKKYKYPKAHIELEKIVQFGREKNDNKRADIVVYTNETWQTIKMIIEVKAPNVENDIQQLKSYLNAEGSPIGVALNGKYQLILFRPYPKDFDTLDQIPAYGEDVSDVLQKRKVLKDLHEQDLKIIITTLEELVLAQSGFDSFDEIFKLIYSKLYDEKEAISRNGEELYFRKSPNGKPEDTKKVIDDLFEDAKKEWPEIFERTDRIKLSPEHLSICVGELQDVRLFGSNLRIIDEAFEYLLPDVAKGKKGQYFTPRIVIDMCVQMMNPKKKEYVIDTACGSAGFLVHAMQYVARNDNLSKAGMKEYAMRYLFGIDFDEKSTKISRAIMVIAGDGKSHIYKTTSLDTKEWPEKFKSELRELDLVKYFDDNTKYFDNLDSLKELEFDVLLANPPFAGEVKEKHLLSQYVLGKNAKGKMQKSVDRHLLFIEKNLDFVKAGGRLAVVLPQGIFNNTSEEYVRKYIMQKARILAVVGLHGNSFKPHTGTKTSVIFLQKWNENEVDAGGSSTVKDYPIFFATQKQSFKDNSGDYIFEKDEEGQAVKDENGNPEYLSDLDEIAQAFVAWGKEQGLSFLK